jgi:hypothetical protein
VNLEVVMSTNENVFLKDDVVFSDQLQFFLLRCRQKFDPTKNQSLKEKS